MEDQEVTISLSESYYPVEAVQSAIYRTANILTGIIADQENGNIKVGLRPKKSFPEGESISDQFIDVLNDEVLRVRVFHETEQLRELIIAHAFSRTNLAEGDGS